MAHISRRLVRLIGWAALLVANANEDTIQLRSGLRMPANGLGTCCRKTARGQPIIDATKAYLQLGGRLIDTAMAYRNHEEIGEALRTSGVKREAVWITSKLASGTVNSYAKGLAAIDNILQEIGTSYLDLVLIHSPQQCTNQISQRLVACEHASHWLTCAQARRWARTRPRRYGRH